MYGNLILSFCTIQGASPSSIFEGNLLFKTELLQGLAIDLQVREPGFSLIQPWEEIKTWDTVVECEGWILSSQ